MPTGNGNGAGLLSKQSLILYATILAVGGGGAGLVKSSADQDIKEVERRVDAVETSQQVILQELNHIQKAIDGNKETGKEILKLLRDHMDGDK